MHLIVMEGLNNSGRKKWKMVAAGVHDTMGACLSWINCAGSQSVPLPDGTPLGQNLVYCYGVIYSWGVESFSFSFSPAHVDFDLIKP